MSPLYAESLLLWEVDRDESGKRCNNTTPSKGEIQIHMITVHEYYNYGVQMTERLKAEQLYADITRLPSTLGINGYWKDRSACIYKVGW